MTSALAEKTVDATLDTLDSERIVGTLDGREGSFVIQHGGLADGTEQSTFGTVTPHSGTGDRRRAGLRGRATEARHGVLSLVYTI